MSAKIKSFGRFLTRCAIALTVIVFMIFVRLAYEPTPVTALGETIVEPFRAAFPERSFDFDGAYLEWSWRQLAFEFSLENVSVSNRDGTPLADFPKLAVGFEGGSLLGGTFIPNRVDITGPELHFDWNAKNFEARVERALFDPEDKPEDEAERPPVIRFMERIIRGEGENTRLKAVKEIRIVDAVITLTERENMVIWEIPDGDFIITRTPNGLGLEADIAFQTEGELIGLSIASQQTGDGLTKTDITMDGLHIANLAEEVKLGELFHAVDMPLYGTLSLWQNAQGGVDLLGFDIGGGPGTIFYERFTPEAARFEDLNFKGSVDPFDKMIAIESLRLEVDGDVIEGDGFVEFTEEESAPALRMVLTSEQLKVDSFLQLWPTAKKSGGRDWIAENVVNGQIKNVRAELAFTPETWGQKPLPNEAMHITLEFDGGDVHYLRPMPPMQNLKGRMQLEGNEAHAVIESATVDGMQIENMVFDIAEMTRSKAQMGSARFDVSGDIQRLMRFADLDPLNIFVKRSIDPADYFGDATVEVRLGVPLYSGAPPEATTYTLEGRIQEAAVPSLLAGGGVSEGDMTMTITPAGLVSQGQALLKGVPFDFYWTQDFIAETPDSFTTRIELSGFLTDAHLHTFGLPDDLTMEGTARVYLSLRGQEGDLKFGQGTADFFNARVKADKMDWHKAPNRAAETSFDLEWTETELLVKNVEVASREFTMQGAFTFDKETGLMKRADVPVFVTPVHDLTATARQDETELLDVEIQARSVNAIPFLETMFEETDEVSFAPNMRLALLAERAYGINEVVYTNVSIEAEKRNEYWITANVLGGLDEGGAFQIALTNNDNARQLLIESDNAGRLSLGADIFRNATGGNMRLTADMNVYEEPLFAEGVLEADGFQLVKSSVLIQALAEEERSGLDEMIREEGMDFSRLSIPFKLENEIFDISDASARGEQFGFTMEGEVDQDFYRMNLNGTVVPAYSINTFISRIPIIGTIIAGGTGEGLFALNFRITGNREEPNVDFKELSAVAPGIFRKILGSQKKGRLEPEPSLREEIAAEDAAEAEAGDKESGEGEAIESAAAPVETEEETGDGAGSS